jgi:hypothetical protein
MEINSLYNIVKFEHLKGEPGNTEIQKSMEEKRKKELMSQKKDKHLRRWERT